MSVTQAIRNPRSYVVRTLGLYRALLFDPERFYDEYLGSRGLKVEIALVAFIGVIGFIGNYYARSRIATVFPEAGFPIGSDVDFQLWRHALAPLVGIVLLWVGLTLALYFVGWLYSTVGQFYHLLKRTAWSLVPLVVFNLLHTIAMVWTALNLAEEDIEDRELVRAPDMRTEQMWSEIAGDIFVVATLFVGVIFVIWTGYIAAYAVRDVRDLDTNEAFRVAAVPTVAFALYLIYEGVTTLLDSGAV